MARCPTGNRLEAYFTLVFGVSSDVPGVAGTSCQATIGPSLRDKQSPVSVVSVSCRKLIGSNFGLLRDGSFKGRFPRLRDISQHALDSKVAVFFIATGRWCPG